MSSRNWKRIQPTSLRQALELCKEHAREKHNLSLERIAERMGLVDHWSLYKWIQTGRFPFNLLGLYETVCGIDFATRWHTAGAGKLLIDAPTGRKVTARDAHELNGVLNDAMGAVLDFYNNKMKAEDALAAIQKGMEGLAWHRQNVQKHVTPELDFTGEQP